MLKHYIFTKIWSKRMQNKKVIQKALKLLAFSVRPNTDKARLLTTFRRLAYFINGFENVNSCLTVVTLWVHALGMLPLLYSSALRKSRHIPRAMIMVSCAENHSVNAL